jgi:tape measure domain-containing protein
MSNNPSLIIDISVKDLASGVLKAIENAIGKMSTSLNNIDGQRTLAPLARQAGQANHAFGNLKNTLVNLAGAYVGLSGLSRFTGDLVSSVAATQQLNTRLQALTSSTEDYNQTWEYLNATANRLSSDVNVLADSYSKLLTLQQVGILTTQDSKDILEGFANVAAQTGAETVQLKQSLFGLTQGLTAGTLRAEELNQITEPLPGLLQKLDQAAGLAAGGFRKMVNAGQITSEMLRITLINALETYEGAAERTANNITPTFTRLTNQYTLFKTALEQPVAAILIPLMEAASQKIQQFTVYVQNNHVQFMELAAGLKNFGDILLKIGTTIAHLIGVMLQFQEVIGLVVKGLMAMMALKVSVWLAAYIVSMGQAVVATHALSASAAGATGKLSVLKSALTAIPGNIKIFLGVTGLIFAIQNIAKLIDGITKLREAKHLLSETTKDYEENLSRLGEKIEQSLAANQQYKDITIASADAIIAKNAEQLAAYQTTLEGARQYYTALKLQQKHFGDNDAALRARDKMQQYEAALQSVTEALEQFADQTQNTLSAVSQKIINQFSMLVEKGKGTQTALNKILEPLKDDQSIANIRNIGDALGQLAQNGEISAKHIRKSFGDNLKDLAGHELRNFQITAVAAFEETAQQAENLGLILQGTLATALDKLSADAYHIATGITTVGKETIELFNVITTNSMATAVEIEAALLGAFKKITTDKGLVELRTGLYSAFEQGRLSAEQFSRLLGQVTTKINELRQANSELGKAFKALGITSQQALNTMAQQAQQAFETIRQAAQQGQAAASDVETAFLAYAQKVIDANNGIITSELEFEAITLGLVDKLMQLGQIGQQTGQQIANGFATATNTIQQLDNTLESTSQSVQQVGESIQQVGSSIQQVGEQGSYYLGDLFEQKFRIMSQAAGDYYQQLHDSLIGEISTFRQWWDVLDKTDKQVQQLFDNESRSLDNMASRLENVNYLTNEEAERLNRVIDHFKLLDNSDLSQVRGQIKSLQQNTEQLNNSIYNTVTSLQNELDRLAGNDAAIEQRRYEEQILKLRQQYETARAAGDEHATSAAQKAIRLAQELHQLRLAQINEEQQTNVNSFTQQGLMLGKITNQFGHLGTTITQVTEEVSEVENGVNQLDRTVSETAADFEQLDQTQLNNIGNQINQLDNNTNNFTQNLSRLRDEFDRLQGNQAAIEQRRYEQQIFELRQQYEVARVAGDEKMLQVLAQSIELTEQIHQQKITQIEDEKQATNELVNNKISAIEQEKVEQAELQKQKLAQVETEKQIINELIDDKTLAAKQEKIEQTELHKQKLAQAEVERQVTDEFKISAIEQEKVEQAELQKQKLAQIETEKQIINELIDDKTLAAKQEKIEQTELHKQKLAQAEVERQVTDELIDQKALAIEQEQAKQAELYQQKLAQEKQAFAQLTEQLQGVNYLTEQEIQALENTINGFKVLNESDLSGVRRQVQTLRQNTDALGNRIDNAVARLQDEWDRKTGNEAAIEQRRYAQELLELQQQYEAARVTGDKQTIENAQKALDLAKALHEQEIKPTVENIAQSFRDLDQTQLNGLRNQVESLTDETSHLHDSLSGTVSNLQDELDRMAGNQTTIERRRYDKQRQRLNEQLKEAQKTSDQTALKTAQEALRLANEIHKKKMAQLKAEKLSKEQSSKRTTGQVLSGPTIAQTVKIEIGTPTGKKASGVYTQEDAQAFIALLQEAGAVAQ